MNSRIIGLVAFWLGALYMFVATWLIMWWVAPTWASAPPEQFDGTAMKFAGPVFMFISLGTPVGILLAAIGMLVHSETGKLGTKSFALIVMGMVVVALSMLFPGTLGYYPFVFGFSGGIILVMFFAAVWFWAKRRRELGGSNKTAADLQLVSFVFFYLAANLTCAVLGNPFSGLYFPEKVLEQNALPYHYAMGTKVAVYFALGWLFTFLSQFTSFKATSSPNVTSTV